MIYIVEIPHQHQPFCWTAEDEYNAVEKIIMANIKRDNLPALAAPFAEWVRYNGLELHSQYVFMDASAAIDGLKEIGGHGAVQAIAALRQELEDTCELPEEPSDEA